MTPFCVLSRRNLSYPFRPSGLKHGRSYSCKLLFTLSLEGFVSKEVNSFPIKQIQTLRANHMEWRVSVLGVHESQVTPFPLPFVFSYESLFPQLLCIHIHANPRGVGAPMTFPPCSFALTCPSALLTLHPAFSSLLLPGLSAPPRQLNPSGSL
jgi:hypothetical protein